MAGYHVEYRGVHTTIERIPGYGWAAITLFYSEGRVHEFDISFYAPTFEQSCKKFRDYVDGKKPPMKQQEFFIYENGTGHLKSVSQVP